MQLYGDGPQYGECFGSLWCEDFMPAVCEWITCHIIKATRGHLVGSWARPISSAPYRCVCVCVCSFLSCRTHTQNSACKHKTLVEHLNINLTFLQVGGGGQKWAWEGFFPSSLPSSDSNWGSLILWDQVSSTPFSLVNWQRFERWERIKKQNNKRGLEWVTRRDGGGLEQIHGRFGQEEMGGALDGPVFQTLQPAVECRDLPLNAHPLWATHEL